MLLFMIHACIGLYLTINIFYNYTACAFTHPGTPGYCPDPGKVLGERASIIDGRKVYEVAYKLNVAPYVSYRYCQVCKCIKPPRAHHDR